MVTPLELEKSRRINFALGRWAIRGLTAVYGSLKSPLVDPLPLFQSEAAFFGWQLFEKPIKDLTISAEDFLANDIRDEDGGRVNEHRDDCHQARRLGSVGLRSFQVSFILIRFLPFLVFTLPNDILPQKWSIYSNFIGHGYQVLSLQSRNWGDPLKNSNLLDQDHHLLLHLLLLPRSNNQSLKTKRIICISTTSTTPANEDDLFLQPHSGSDASTSSSSLCQMPTLGCYNQQIFC